MSGVATAIIGGAVISGVVASKSAKDAAKAQTKASDTGISEQRRQFDITQQQFQPFQEAGTEALEQQRALLGIGADPSAQQRADLQSQLDAIDNPAVAAAGAPGGSFLGSIGRTGSIGTAGAVGRVVANMFPDAAAAQAQAQSGVDPSVRRSEIQSQLDALPQFDAQAQQQAAFDRLNVSPGQKFLRDRAQKNLVRNAAAIGGLGGGNVRSALVQQGVGFAQQDLENQFGRLGQLAGQGQTATANVGQFGQATAGNIANLQAQSGAARASGIQGQNQAFQQGLSGVFTGLGQSGLFNQSPGQTLPASNTNPFARNA